MGHSMIVMPKLLIRPQAVLRPMHLHVREMGRLARPHVVAALLQVKRELVLVRQMGSNV